MAKGLSPTQRTLAELRARGLMVGNVERFNRFAGPHGIRQDLFGFIDLIACSQAEGIIGVQTTGTDFAGHRKKLLGDRSEEVRDWLRSGGRVELWGWRKVLKVRGGKQRVYRPRVEEITLATLEAAGSLPEGEDDSGGPERPGASTGDPTASGGDGS